MFDIGWSEMAVVALVALLVIGPKELPNTMRMVGRWTRKARALTREFRSGFDEMVREAELEDVRKSVETAKSGSISKQVKDTIDPTGWVDKSLKDVEKTAVADPAAPEAPGAAEAKTTAGANGLATENKIAPAHSIAPSPDASVAETSTGPAPKKPEPVAAAAPPDEDRDVPSKNAG
ncbi:MAG TPA: Sec-independent protein translocase protein TatB [Kiloniellaceae bacterium]|nr:Sec-independent protein translocase protein TatB [Kiloniellaceae bacterium]